MKKINLNLNNKHYPIFVNRGIIKELYKYLLIYLSNNKIIIITQKTIYEHYKDNFKILYSKFNLKFIFIENNETSKSFDGYKKIINHLLDFKCNRETTLIAFGGGVVGDLTGFVASTYMRGINYIQIPTTLLSMVDSSIGGKTGINLSKGKNLIGSFYHPKLVIIDPDLIQTLPEKEIISGLGEMIKYGVISDIKLLLFLKDNIKNIIMGINLELLTKAIIKCLKIKIDIVEKDEKEGNIRKILNFGHTLGHALENELGYGEISHGQAVAYGLVTASFLSTKIHALNNKEYQIIKDCIKQLSLPLIKKINIESIIETMKNDKKNNNNINFVLIKKIGNPTINNIIKVSQIKEAIESNEYISS